MTSALSSTSDRRHRTSTVNPTDSSVRTSLRTRGSAGNFAYTTWQTGTCEIDEERIVILLLRERQSCAQGTQAVHRKDGARSSRVREASARERQVASSPSSRAGSPSAKTEHSETHQNGQVEACRACCTIAPCKISHYRRDDVTDLHS